ncbi:NUDIX domain-containing protein [Nocardioides psychrotolerans]|uniref:NUDIX hydrolase n=1 Tax=Nocardioides psychrotolerans TaxID=1005945 RepID=UPI0031376EF9
MTSSPLPVLVAAGVLVRRDDLLLLQRRGDDRTWGVPGGALEPGETLEQTARRELLEETGLTAGALTLLDVYSGPDFRVRYPDGFEAYVVGATFETSDVAGSLTVDGEETLELGWFPVSSLPAPMSAYTRALLARVGISSPTQVPERPGPGT